ncbi:CYFA0S05e03620g1_1 [Cyberlindnera fabianii]|uniref:CYFA0S05e03620g1_1 n=1 Tax=Cyberlindnera fabianii TaxID=36022 RepID=A0A061AZ87_CYBFA|nr:CYFA0S05e03620g1_1 [Cyberlindnera fabianii]
MDIEDTEKTGDLLPDEKEQLEGHSASLSQESDFFLKYYSGHQGQFGHEFLEFEVRLAPDGKSASVSYTNNTNYRREAIIRKQFAVSRTVAKELQRFVEEAEIMRETDKNWPTKNREGAQELTISMGGAHVRLATCKIGSLADVKNSADPDGLRAFYYFVQDVKAFMFSLISLHFKVRFQKSNNMHNNLLTYASDQTILRSVWPSSLTLSNSYRALVITN